MKGIISSINKNKEGENTYGFILGEDKISYFFYKYDLHNCSMFDLSYGDSVVFDPNPSNPEGPAATSIMLEEQENITNAVSAPGLHQDFPIGLFSSEEKDIIRFLSGVFFISTGNVINIANSNYKYCYLKPTEFFARTFKLNREIVLVFSDYSVFQPRCLDAASRVYRQINTKLRLERAFHVFVSRDTNVQEGMKTVINDGDLNQIVIPFSYEELTSANRTEEMIKERFRKYLFDQDLFAVSTPIESSVFFFGRRDYCADLVTKCKNHTICGIFGLRRSGKTSALYAVRDSLHAENLPVVFIPCEGSLSTLNWRLALHKVVSYVYQELGLNRNDIDQNDYNTMSAATFFEEDMNAALSKCSSTVTLMFDEIENITFGVNHGEQSGNLWFDGEAFVNFWNTIKSYYSKYPTRLSILIAGTNPMINEVNLIGSKHLTNPMLGQLSSSNQGAYLPAFSMDDTKNMVNSLGGYMGLSFDDYCISALTKDCAGHPYLIRILCSQINKCIKEEAVKRPIVVTKSIYVKAYKQFKISAEASSFFTMVLEILTSNYGKEFNTLKQLALGNDDIMSKTHDEQTLLHLIGYGLVDCNGGNYVIPFEAIADYLSGAYRFERQGLSIEDQAEEIILRVNGIERALRKLTKNTLVVQYGKEATRTKVISAMSQSAYVSKRNVDAAKTMDIKDLFDASVNVILLSVLFKLILDDFKLFANVFTDSKNSVENNFDVLNRARRCPSHSYSEDAKNWSWEFFTQFRKSASYFENILADLE